MKTSRFPEERIITILKERHAGRAGMGGET